MSRRSPVQEIIGYFLDKVANSQGPVYDDLYYRYFDERTREPNRNVQQLENRAIDLYEFYLDYYNNYSEDQCLNMACEDFEGFIWANAADRLYQNRRIDERDVDFKEVDRLLEMSERVTKDMRNWANRQRQSSRYDDRQYQQYGHRDSHHQGGQFANNGRRPSSPYASNGHKDESIYNRTTSPYQRTSSNTHRPSAFVSTENTNTTSANTDGVVSNERNFQRHSASRWDDTSDAKVERVNQQQYVQHNTSQERVSHTRSEEIEKPVYITNLNDVKDLKIHPEQGYHYGVDPFTQRLRIHIKDGYIWQEVLDVATMSLEDHLTVINPERINCRAKFNNPLIFVTEGQDVSIRAKSELGVRYQALMDEWVASGEIKTNEKVWVNLPTELKNKIASETTQRMLAEMKAKGEAYLQEQSKEMQERINQLSNKPTRAKRKSALFDVDDVANESIVEPIIMTINTQEEPLLVKDLNAVWDTALTHAVDNVEEVGIRIPYNKVGILYASTQVTEIRRVSKLLSAIKDEDKMTTLFRILREGGLSEDLRMLLNRQLTTLLQHGLKIFHLGLNTSDFSEDFVALVGMLEERQKKGILEAETLDAFLNYLNTHFPDFVELNVEQLKKVYPTFEEEKLVVQSERSIYQYETGNFTYVQLTSSELNIRPELMRIPYDSNRILHSVLQEDNLDDVYILATKDKLFFEVSCLEDRYYVLRPLSVI